MKKFRIKDLKKVKTIIKQKIIQDFIINILKIDQKKYIKNLLNFKRKISY